MINRVSIVSLNGQLYYSAIHVRESCQTVWTPSCERETSAASGRFADELRPSFERAQNCLKVAMLPIGLNQTRKCPLQIDTIRAESPCDACSPRYKVKSWYPFAARYAKDQSRRVASEPAADNDASEDIRRKSDSSKMVWVRQEKSMLMECKRASEVAIVV
jgi:hypothetical protein